MTVIGFFQNRIRRLAALLAGGAVIAACTVQGGSPSFEETTRTLFEAVYVDTDSIHIDPLDSSRFTRAGLNGLSRIDPTVDFSFENDLVVLSVADRAVETRPLPAPDASPEVWAALASDMVLKARAEAPVAEKTPEDEIHEAFIDSALLTLDRFSRYANPTDAAEYRAEREGFGGIGVDLESHPNGARVQGLEPGQPAAQAGLAVGDVITRVDETDIVGWTLRDIVALLRGAQDSPVDLVIMREGLPAPWPVTVGRTRIVPNTVFYDRNSDHGIIRISGFNKLTAKRLAEVVSQARSDRESALNGLILDLRGNLGGLLDQAVVAADLFLDDGMITRADGRHPESHQRFDAEPGDIADGLRMVVLINGASASAAEVLASALQDNGRAVVVGMSSFGKGSIQNVIQLPNGGELYVTWARFVAPSGYALDRLGVMPTVCTSGAGDAVDALDRAMDAATLGPAAPLAKRRSVDPTDDHAVRELLAACPWTPHASGDIDMAIAELLLESPTLVRQALRVARSPDGV